MIIKTIDDLIKCYKGHTERVTQYLEVSPQLGIKLTDFEFGKILRATTKTYIEMAEELKVALEGDK